MKASRRLTRRPVEMKRWIVEQTLAPGASVAKVARRHGVNAKQVFAWRKQYREGRLVHEKWPPKAALPGHDPATSAGQALIRIGMIDHHGGLRPLPASGDPSASFPVPPRPTCCADAPSRREERAAPSTRGIPPGGMIEIELRNGIKVRVDAGIEEAALRLALAVAGELT